MYELAVTTVFPISLIILVITRHARLYEMVSPADGIIKEVVVKKGDIVNLKDTLIIIG